MSSIFDRLNAELDQIGDRVRTALETSKLHLERSRLVGIRSRIAYKLGMLMYRRERGGEVNQAELDALFARMDDVSAKIARIDQEIESVHAEKAELNDQPAPPADPAEADVKDVTAEPGGN